MNQLQQFHYDAAEGNTKHIIEHISNNIDLNTRNSMGGTALMIAAKRGHFETVKILLEAGANPNLKMYDSEVTALGTAAQEENNEIILELIKHGVNINFARPNGETALITAAFHGNKSTIKLLLENGANPYSKDFNGNSAYDWAKKNNHKDVASELNFTRKSRKKGFFSKMTSFFVASLNRKTPEDEELNRLVSGKIFCFMIPGTKSQVNSDVQDYLQNHGAIIGQITQVGEAQLVVHIEPTKFILSSVSKKKRVEKEITTHEPVKQIIKEISKILK